MKKTHEVVAAIIVYQNKVLCMQRGKGKFDYISYKYEFPGGKVEPGETQEAAIEREIKEELDLQIMVKNDFYTVSHEYLDFNIVMKSFICHTNSSNLTLSEHVDAQWLDINDIKFKELDWAAADIPIVEELIEKGF